MNVTLGHYLQVKMCVKVVFLLCKSVNDAEYLLQAKNEPAGKKPADKNDTKKSGSERRHSSDSKSEK